MSDEAGRVLPRCFACGREIVLAPHEVDTRDDQIALVGPECARKVARAGEMGYQPPRGGPRLYPMPKEIAR